METNKIAETWLLPLKEMDGCSIKVKDTEGHPAFDYFGDYPLADLLKIINDEAPADPEILKEYRVAGPDILVRGKLWLRIRGWGYLTGHSSYALGLEPTEAAARQNELRTWILSRIS